MNAFIRGLQFDSMKKTPLTVQYIVQTASLDDMRKYRDGGTGWTALEIVGHLRDTEGVFIERVNMTLTEENGKFVHHDVDAEAIERRYNELDPQVTIAAWMEQRKALLAILQGVSEEAWSRVGVHARRGPLTLHEQFCLMAWHDTNHIEQMIRTLAEKK